MVAEITGYKNSGCCYPGRPTCRPAGSGSCGVALPLELQQVVSTVPDYPHLLFHFSYQETVWTVWVRIEGDCEVRRWGVSERVFSFFAC